MNKKAFTLIELLVVIAIIGILATLAIVSLQQARQNARNAKRVADLRQMQTALELYFNENNGYPSATEFEIGEPLISFSTGKILMQQIPSAPSVADGSCLTSNYTYTINEDNSSYKLSTCISKDINNLPAGIITATPNSLGYLDACDNQTELIDQRDGNVYDVVAIGNQCWTAENLKYLPEVFPSAEGSETTPYYYVYDYQGSDVAAAKATTNYNTYGVLYNWPAAMDGGTAEGAKGVCPEGWYLPRDGDWNVLELFVLNMINSPNAQYPCSTSEIGWQRCADNTGASSGANGVGQALISIGLGSGVGAGTDLVSFSSILSGYRRSAGTFSGLTSEDIHWSSTPLSSTSAWFRSLYSIYSTISRRSITKAYGFSVRCLKN